MDEDRRISYFLLGLGVGVAVGFLFAPKSGTETRELIKSKAEEGKEFLARRGTEWKDSATELLDRGKQAVSRQKEQVAAAVEAGKQAYRETAGHTEPSADPSAYVEGV
ncbi:MAG TPA: YtxH domain-containing protein [Bryobacteraceae bacterium]|nr:YtxH domain-containing protein [Bryobacteraceae bacterium]